MLNLATNTGGKYMTFSLIFTLLGAMAISSLVAFSIR